MVSRKRAFTVIEVMICCGLLVVLSTVLFSALQGVAQLWYKNSAHDDAVAQILRAKASLVRDLANGSRQTGQFEVAQVGPNLSGHDGDALTFLSSDSGAGGDSWSATGSGQASFACQVTYFLIIPSSADGLGFTPTSGPADSAGYEQQDPCKWLIRRVDSPVPAGSPQTLLPNWKSVFGAPLRPGSTVDGSPTPLVGATAATQRLLANQIFQFRVLKTAPTWSLQISAVMVKDAQRQVAIGSIPLNPSIYTVVEQCGITANN